MNARATTIIRIFPPPIYLLWNNISNPCIFRCSGRPGSQVYILTNTCENVTLNNNYDKRLWDYIKTGLTTSYIYVEEVRPMWRNTYLVGKKKPNSMISMHTPTIRWAAAAATATVCWYIHSKQGTECTRTEPTQYTGIPCTRKNGHKKAVYLYLIIRLCDASDNAMPEEQSL